MHKGASLLLWRDYFPEGEIVGIDIRLSDGFDPGERIRVYEGSQADTAFLTRVAAEAAPGGFDIIIDDASHIGALTKTAFWHLFENHLKPGGIYAIEDWGTGYLDDWPDGRKLDIGAYGARGPLRSWLGRKLKLKVPERCHSYGMVGFVKQLVDEQGAANVTKGRFDGKPERESKLESITITPPIVFVRKPG